MKTHPCIKKAPAKIFTLFLGVAACLPWFGPGAHAQPSVYWGAFMDGSGNLTNATDWAAVTNFESEAGKSVSIINFFASWTYGSATNGTETFPATAMTDIRNHGSIPLFTWQPQNGNLGTTQSFNLSNIINGVYDPYITNWAAAAKAWGHPFFLRFAHEMNGSWYPWSEGTNGNTKGQYVEMWHHVHDLFSKMGATNATWVWCVNTPYSTSTPIDGLYPGDNYTDWISMDAYNRGGSGNQDFTNLIGETYDELENLAGVKGVYDVAPCKPIMIAENGTVEYTNYSKALWFTNALGDYLKYIFPQVKAYCYFNQNKNGYTNEINSSPGAQAAFAWSIGLSYYTNNGYAALAQFPIQPMTNNAYGADIAPFVSIQQPAALTVTAGSTTNLTVSALDGSGITAVNFYVNGAFQATDTSPPYSCSWTVPAGANQPYYVTAKAFDGAGNQMTSIVYYVSQ